MNETPPPQQRTRRLWKKWLLGLILFGALVTVVRFAINRYGAGQLQSAIAEYEAQGGTLDFQASLPDPPPDDSNFCAIPVLQDIAHKEAGKTVRDRLESLVIRELFLQSLTTPRVPPQTISSTLSRQATDLTAWARYLHQDPSITQNQAARKIQEALKPDMPLVNTLIHGLDRNEAQWTPALKTIKLPEYLPEIGPRHVVSTDTLIETLALLALTAIEQGKPETARQLLLVQFRLTRGCLNTPLLINTLIGVLQLNKSLSCLHDVSASQTTDSTQLHSLQKELERIDLRQTFLQAYRSELSWCHHVIQYSKTHRHHIEYEFKGTEWKPAIPRSLLRHSIPDGWYDLNSATLLQLGNSYIVEPLQKGMQIDDLAMEDLETKLMEIRDNLRPDAFFASRFLSSTLHNHRRVTFAQAQLRLAVTALRLESYFIQHGAYPEALADLPPGMSYQRTPTRYRLWLPGPDGEDDGGKRILDPENPEKTKFHHPDYQGDWVWDYPEDS